MQIMWILTTGLKLYDPDIKKIFSTTGDQIRG